MQLFSMGNYTASLDSMDDAEGSVAQVDELDEQFLLSPEA